MNQANYWFIDVKHYCSRARRPVTLWKSEVYPLFRKCSKELKQVCQCNSKSWFLQGRIQKTENHDSSLETVLICKTQEEDPTPHNQISQLHDFAFPLTGNFLETVYACSGQSSKFFLLRTPPLTGCWGEF